MALLHRAAIADDVRKCYENGSPHRFQKLIRPSLQKGRLDISIVGFELFGATSRNLIFSDQSLRFFRWKSHHALNLSSRHKCPATKFDWRDFPTLHEKIKIGIADAEISTGVCDGKMAWRIRHNGSSAKIGV
jgi:hypothetical protein